MYNISSIENGWADLAQFFLTVRNCQEKVLTKKNVGKVLLFKKSLFSLIIFDPVDKWAIENELLNETIKKLLILFLVLNDGYCINIKQQVPKQTKMLFWRVIMHIGWW
jgi:hypothetical protein